MWLGRILGMFFGLLFAKAPGLIMGFVAGYIFDKGYYRVDNEGISWNPYLQHRIQKDFFKATFVVMGRIAKSDGVVSKKEIEVARSIMERMELKEKQRLQAIEYFNLGKDLAYNLNEVLHPLFEECQKKFSLLQLFMEVQIEAAAADGYVGQEELKILRQVSESLGLGQGALEKLLTMYHGRQKFHNWEHFARQKAESEYRSNAEQEQRNNHYGQSKRDAEGLAAAYEMLGVDTDCGDDELKKSYRRLLSQHHPDKLVAKGLPEEMIKVANEKTYEIRMAYEQIMEAREKDKANAA